jgi:hypothetical protein
VGRRQQWRLGGVAAQEKGISRNHGGIAALQDEAAVGEAPRAPMGRRCFLGGRRWSSGSSGAGARGRKMSGVVE